MSLPENVAPEVGAENAKTPPPPPPAASNSARLNKSPVPRKNQASDEMSGQQDQRPASRCSSAASSARSSLSSSSQQFLYQPPAQLQSQAAHLCSSTGTGNSSARSSTGSSSAVSLPFNSACNSSQLNQNNHTNGSGSSSSGNRHHQHQHHNHQNHGNANRQAKRQLYLAKGKKFIQSIPIPLLATTILTILILCLLLSECKSLNVMTAASAMKHKQQQQQDNERSSPLEQLNEQQDNEAIVAMLRSPDQQAAVSVAAAAAAASSETALDPQRSALLSGASVETATQATESTGSQQPEANKWQSDSGEQLQIMMAPRRHASQRSPQLPHAREHELPARHRQQLASLRRNFIASQLMRHQQQQQQPHQAKRHSQPPMESLGGGGGESSAGSGESMDAGETAEQQLAAHDANLESLGAMLMGSGEAPPEPMSELAEEGAGSGSDSALYLDGESSAGGGGGQRPAYLRSGTMVPLEVDLNGSSSSQLAAAGEQQAEQPQRQSHHSNAYQSHHHQQQHHNYNHNNNNNNNNNNREHHASNRHSSHGNQVNNQHRATIDQEAQLQQQQQQQAAMQQAHPPLNNHDRPFDVVQIQCNNTDEGFERFACPSPDHKGRWRCIEDRLFCDGYFDCPGREDEERVSCMYYKLLRQRGRINFQTNFGCETMNTEEREQNNNNTTNGEDTESYYTISTN